MKALRTINSLSPEMQATKHYIQLLVMDNHVYDQYALTSLNVAVTLHGQKAFE